MKRSKHAGNGRSAREADKVARRAQSQRQRISLKQQLSSARTVAAQEGHEASDGSPWKTSLMGS